MRVHSAVTPPIILPPTMHMRSTTPNKKDDDVYVYIVV